MTRHQLARTLAGKTISIVSSDRAWGDPEDEWDNVNIRFTDGSVLNLVATGHDPDGIGFWLSNTTDPDVD